MRKIGEIQACTALYVVFYVITENDCVCYRFWVISMLLNDILVNPQAGCSEYAEISNYLRMRASLEHKNGTWRTLFLLSPQFNSVQIQSV